MRMISSESRHPSRIKSRIGFFGIMRATVPAASARRGLKLACWSSFGKGAEAANAKFPKGIGVTRALEAETV
jgi:hypothetical protein